MPRPSPRPSPRPARTAALTATASLLAATGLLAAHPLPARADEAYAVPADGLAITGHGFGHGRGMGQYGAEGAALSGLSAAQILAFYYPGTASGALPGPSTLRVRIDEDTDSVVEVYAAAGLTVSDADGSRWVLPAGPDRWRVLADPSGGQHVQQRLGGTWVDWLRPGGASFYQARFDGPSVVRLALPDGTSRGYRGAITAGRAGGSALYTVDDVGVEDYLRAVVPAESPAFFAPAALQAQAVAARTYAGYLRAHAGSTYDICSSSACQVYPGAVSYSSAGTASVREYASTDAAVAATAGQVRTYGGGLAFTEFTSSTGGENAPGSVPYLVAHPDPYDDFAGNPVHTWHVTLTRSALAAAFPTVGTPTALRVLARDGRGDWGGRVLSVAVDGTAGSTTVTGDSFRSRLGLRETYWGVDATAPLSAIQQHWLELGGAAGFLGGPVGSEYAVTGGRAVDYAGGRIYWSPATGAHEVHGAIEGHHDALGGAAGLLGLPVSDEHDVPGGRGSDFTGGTVLWSSPTGAWAVHGLIGVHYAGLGGPGGLLGLPVSDEHDVPGGRASDFTGGSVLWSPATGAAEVHGRIGVHYAELGGPGGLLGLPLGDEHAVPGGRASDFVSGRLYWSPATGAHEVHGLIGTHYDALGGASAWGLPLTDELAVPGGRGSHFERVDVLWSPATGAHEVHGAIRDSYLQLGGAASALGLPTTDEYAVPGGRRNDFTGGSLGWDAATGVVTLTLLGALPR